MTLTRRGRVLRLLSDLLLGLALGLIAYEALTGAFTWREQGRLRAVFERAARADAAEASSVPTNEWDFSGWASQDSAYWRQLAEGGVFGKIVAPSAGIDAVVVKGVSREDLKLGPGWVTFTDVPGRTGNTGISGHRTTYLAPFQRLDELHDGDAVDFYSPYRRYRYRVFRKMAVTPDRVDVMASTVQPQLTLTACHPPYSARYRLVVQARLVSVRRLAAR